MSLKPGFAYQCPGCMLPLRPHDGPWAIYHCLYCKRSVDLYRDPEPEQIPVATEPEPYDPHKNAVVIKLFQDGPPLRPTGAPLPLQKPGKKNFFELIKDFFHSKKTGP